MNAYLNDLTHFFTRFMKIYHEEIAKKKDTLYHIIKIENSPQSCIYFHVACKNIQLKMPLSKLMHSSLLLGFSKPDIAIITHLGTKHEAKEAINFTVNSSDLNELHTVITFQGTDNGTIYRKTAEEIMYDAKLLVQFSKEDLRSIIFAAAQDQHRIEETF